MAYDGRYQKNQKTLSNIMQGLDLERFLALFYKFL
jgi:hypothetical protein